MDILNKEFKHCLERFKANTIIVSNGKWTQVFVDGKPVSEGCVRVAFTHDIRLRTSQKAKLELDYTTTIEPKTNENDIYLSFSD